MEILNIYVIEIHSFQTATLGLYAGYRPLYAYMQEAHNQVHSA